MRSSYGLGRTHAAENDVTMGPPEGWANPGTLPGVIWSGGLGETPDDMLKYDPTFPEFGDIIRNVADEFPVICADLGGVATWGNSTVISRTTEAITFLQGASSPCRAASGKVFLFAYSMGFIDLMSWARTNVASVAAAVAVVGATDLNAIYTANRVGAAAGINTAYGGTYSTTTDAPTHSPIAFASSLTFPIKMWYGATDTTVLPAETLAFAAAAPDCEAVSMTGGHTTFTPPASMHDDIIDFFTANAP